MAKKKKLEIPDQLPVLPMRNMVIFPGVPTQLLVRRDRSRELIRSAMEQGRIIVAVTQRDIAVDDPAPSDLSRVGIVGLIHRTFDLPDGNVQVLLRGLQRVKLTKYVQK